MYFELGKQAWMLAKQLKPSFVVMKGGGLICCPWLVQEEEQLFYSFPSLQQLHGATEDALRLAGFGYR